MPHHLTVDLGREVTLKGITYLPRQDMANGRIAECEIYCSTDPSLLGRARGQGEVAEHGATPDSALHGSRSGRAI